MAKILVVDDDYFIRIVLKHTLEDYQVLLAEDGHQAIALAEWERPDLILMDIVMPGLDGITTARTIASQRATPILFMSEQADEITIPPGLSAQPTIRKPSDPLELRSIIGCALFELISHKLHLQSATGMPLNVACS